MIETIAGGNTLAQPGDPRRGAPGKMRHPLPGWGLWMLLGTAFALVQPPAACDPAMALRTIEQLRSDAASKDAKLRRAAIQRAGEIGRDALPALEQVFLFDGSEGHYALMREDRLHALRILERIGASESIPILIVAAADRETEVRAEARRQLMQVHGVTIDGLRREWLLSEDWFLRQGAMTVLLESGATVDELAREIVAAHGGAVGARQVAAVRALGQLESREAIPLLLALIGDQASGLPLRLEALGALHHIDSREVPLEAWISALGDSGMRSLYLATMSGVHIAMRQLEAAGARAAPVLGRALADSDPVVRMRAAWILGRIGTAAAKAVPALRRAADDADRGVSDEARRSLARIAPDGPPLKLSGTSGNAGLPPPVCVSERTDTVFIDNGLVSCEVARADGTLVSLRRAGDPRNLFGDRGSWYSPPHWSAPGQRGVRAGGGEARIARRGDDLVEVEVTMRLDEPRPLTVEQHFVVRRGVSGVYQYAVFRKPLETKPAEAIFDYARFMKVDARLFHHAAVSDSLHGEVYSPERIAELQLRRRELSNATYRQPDGRVWAKYSWCPYEQETRLHGATGDGIGIWVIIPNDESGYNLPSNHPGTVHDEGDGGASVVIITHQEGVPHNIGSEQRANLGPGPWEKLYGPVLLYVNGGGGHAAMWADAKRRAEVEADAHPQAWMRHELYPLERASIRGRALMPGGRAAAGAWIILCNPHPERERAWQRHRGPYIYRTFAGADGSFGITGARAGAYSLIARIDGVLGEGRLDGVVLRPGDRLDAGVLAISEDRRGRLIWEIGSHDGTPREFSGAPDSHEWCGWLNNYGRRFPRGVDYTVGASDPARDWYYCQPGGWPEGFSARCRPTEWRIHFDLPSVPDEGTILTVCIAATRGGRLHVQCNEGAVQTRQLVESDPRTSVCMAPDRGAYYGFRNERFQLAPGIMRPGRNTLRFRFGSGNSAFEAIMYDHIRLEASGPAGPDPGGGLRPRIGM